MTNIEKSLRMAAPLLKSNRYLAESAACYAALDDIAEMKKSKREIRRVKKELEKLAFSCDKGVIQSPKGAIPISDANRLIDRLASFVGL